MNTVALRPERTTDYSAPLFLLADASDPVPAAPRPEDPEDRCRHLYNEIFTQRYRMQQNLRSRYGNAATSAQELKNKISELRDNCRDYIREFGTAEDEEKFIDGVVIGDIEKEADKALQSSLWQQSSGSSLSRLGDRLNHIHQQGSSAWEKHKNEIFLTVTTLKEQAAKLS
jgi:hypothetical protein